MANWNTQTTRDVDLDEIAWMSEKEVTTELEQSGYTEKDINAEIDKLKDEFPNEITGKN